ncbi:MAG TPA: hypothetical protein VF895_01135 [Gaiellaceae bacterium]
MDPAKALADLKQISSQVREAVIFDEGGTVVASTLADGGTAATMAEGAARLLEAAAEAAPEGAQRVVQLEAALGDGSVALVREGDRTIAATTAPEPTIGLVFYDLRTCLRSLGDVEEKPKTRKKPSTTRRKKTDSGAAA